MEDQLREELGNFKEITMELIDSLNNEAYDELDVLFNKRQESINAMENLEYSKQEFAIICEESNITKLQQELTVLLEEKKSVLKSKIDKFSEQKNANKSYNNKFSVDSIYFNKKY
jgi:hypothetical protein